MWKCCKCGWLNSEDFCLHCKTRKNDPMGHPNTKYNTYLPTSETSYEKPSINSPRHEHVSKGELFFFFMAIIFFASIIAFTEMAAHSISSSENRNPVTYSSECTCHLNEGETTTQIENHDDLMPAIISIDHDRSFEDYTPIFVAAGGSRSYVITEGGTLWNWGVSSNRPTKGIMVNSPVPVPIMEDVVFVSAGTRHTMVITEDATLWGWGQSCCGQIGNGIRADWQPIPVPVLENVIYVSVGARSHTMAITEDGTLWGWGRNNDGQLGIGTGGGGFFAGHIVYPYPTRVKENVRSVSAASSHTIAITNDGNLWAWGSGRNLGIGAEISNDERLTNGYGLAPILIMEDVISASASSHTMAVTSDGTLWGWGDNRSGRVTEPESLQQIPAPLPIKDNIVSVYAISSRTFAIDSDNTLWAWGGNGRGGVGNGTNDSGPTPYIILENIVAIAGESHTLAIDSDGVLWVWGSNRSGQLGDGSSVESRNHPVRLN